MWTDSRRIVIVAGVILAYFIIFPDDLTAVLAPAKQVLALTNDISPWLYIVAAAGVIARALVRCFATARGMTSR